MFLNKFVVLLVVFLANATSAEPFGYLEEILLKCPTYRGNGPYSPLCDLGNSPGLLLDKSHDYHCSFGKIYDQFIPGRFIGINDRDETYKISGTLIVFWKIETELCQNLSKIEGQFKIKIENYEQIWMPSLIHSNSLHDYAMQREDFTTRLFLTTTQSGELAFELHKIGIFESTCDLNLDRFPFDEQTCSVNIINYESALVLVMEGACKVDRDNFLLDTNSTMDISSFVRGGSRWKPTDNWCTSSIDSISFGRRSISAFHVKFKRISTDYVYSYLLPGGLISFLTLGLFGLSPKSFDRPFIALTIVLALVFVNAEVAQQIPQKPTRVFLCNYIDTCCLISFFCTIYFVISNWLSNSITVAGLISKNRIKYIDIFNFCIALAAFLYLNFYALKLANQ